MSTVSSRLSAGAALSARRSECFHFAVYAESAPDVMPRVLEQFAKRDLVPTCWHSTIVEGPHTELQIDDLQPETGLYIARCLAALVNVSEVVTSAG